MDFMRATWPYAVAIAATLALTFLVLERPVLASAAVAAVAVTIVAVRTRDWWRRTYLVTILAMFAGASHFETVAAIGNTAKIAALGLLVAVTFFSTFRRPQQYNNGIHKAAIRILWFTVLLGVASIVWTDLRATTALGVATFAALVFVLSRTSTVRWQDTRLMLGDIGAMYWTSTAVLAAGAALAFAGVGESVSTFSGRTQGLLNNPNLLGMLAAITLAVGIGWASHKRSPLVWASLFIPASQVILSDSRTAMVAVAVGIAFALARRRVARIIALGVLLVIGLLAARVFNVSLFGDGVNRFTAMEGGDLLNTRTLAWSDVITRAQTDPLGVGWSSTTEALEQLNAAGTTAGLSSIHNAYLQLVFELGWAGILSALLALILFAVVAFKADTSGLGIGLVAVVVTGALIHLGESAMFGTGQPYPYLFWFAALAAAMGTREQNPGESLSEASTTRGGIRSRMARV